MEATTENTATTPPRRCLIEVRRAVRFKGIVEQARELGCSTYHLRGVLQGSRLPGPELAAKLAERGIETPAMKRAARRRPA